MTPHLLSGRDARRIALRAQALDHDRPTDALDVVRRLSLLKIEPTSYVAPNADLVVWSRIGSTYDPPELDDLLDQGRLVELQTTIRPAEDLAPHRALMAAWPGPAPLRPWQEDNRAWVEANDVARREVLARLEGEGPLRTGDLPDLTEVPWLSTGWTHEKNLARLLDFLVARGEVAVAGREAGQRVWDLAERVYPDAPVPSYDDAVRLLHERRLRVLGLARSRGPQVPTESFDVGDAGEEAVVEGTRGAWRVDPTLLDGLGGRWPGRAALLSPLDRLLHDRRRMTELFEYDYVLEMYKPAAARRWGYFALPVLHGDRLVGKLDAHADHGAGALRVHALHWDTPPTRAAESAVDRQVVDLARWLGLEVVRET